MLKTKVISLDKTLAKTVIAKSIVFSVFLSVATILPALIHQQFITGPIINAILFASTIILGRESAIIIGLIPSLIALSFGLLSPALAPIVPFIMMSNALLVMIFGAFRKKNYWIGMIFASILKFVFLFVTSSIVINLLLKKEVATKVAQIMSWPQLITAIMGGIIAFLIIKATKKD
ncbi:MAG: ECF transporter S component [Candidatus Paceibacterota bacterium]|jgi:hypothetical protein